MLVKNKKGGLKKCMIIYNDIIVFLLTSLFGGYYGITIFPFIYQN
jgi:hypothetical protein